MQTDKHGRPIQIITTDPNEVTVIAFDKNGNESIRVSHKDVESALYSINILAPYVPPIPGQSIALHTPALIFVNDNNEVIQELAENQLTEEMVTTYGLQNLRFIELDETKLLTECNLFDNNITYYIDVLDVATAVIKIDDKHAPYIKDKALTQVESNFLRLFPDSSLENQAYDERLKFYQFKQDLLKKKQELTNIILNSTSLSNFIKDYTTANTWPTMNTTGFIGSIGYSGSQ